MLSRLTSPFREFGPVAGALYLLNRALRTVSPHLGLYVYEMLAQPIPDKPLLPAALAKNLATREIPKGDPAVARMPARPEIIEERYRQGAVCLGVFKGQEFVGYFWLCLGPYDEDEVRATFVGTPEAESAFDFDLYLFPEHRLGIGFAAVWDAANRYLRERGRKVSFSRLTRFNLASRRAHQRLGSKVAAKAVFFQAWDFQLMAATAAPYVHASLDRRTRVRLRLRPDVVRR